MNDFLRKCSWQADSEERNPNGLLTLRGRKRDIKELLLALASTQAPGLDTLQVESIQFLPSRPNGIQNSSRIHTGKERVQSLHSQANTRQRISRNLVRILQRCKDDAMGENSVIKIIFTEKPYDHFQRDK